MISAKEKTIKTSKGDINYQHDISDFKYWCQEISQ
jgi:hypothetical protein